MKPKKFIIIFVSGMLALLSGIAFWVREIVSAIVNVMVPDPWGYPPVKRLFAVTLPTQIRSFLAWMYAMYARWHITHQGVTCI